MKRGVDKKRREWKEEKKERMGAKVVNEREERRSVKKRRGEGEEMITKKSKTVEERGE